ncbi:hypothetical protein FDECE_13249 [Fusarium decemcellulare]|nr:hypothetical protein FDECE_13249 [Fusarium decemcellulare]
MEELKDILSVCPRDAGGGGPVGLAAAHALTRAKVDFVVLERNPSAISNAGSNFVKLPTGLAVLSQFGLMDMLNRLQRKLRRLREALWLRFPIDDRLQTGASCETRGCGISCQVFAGRQTAVVGVYERLEKPTRERTRFIQLDKDALVDRWGKLLLMKNSNLTLREAFDSQVQASLVNLEEGVLQHWSWGGRVVLAGDAAHKYTPSTGAGCNDGIVDAIVLVSEVSSTLKRLSATSVSSKSLPEPAQLTAAFEAYRASRYDFVVQQCKDAGQVTTLASWPSMIEKFIDCYLVSQRPLQKFLVGQEAKTIAQTPALHFIRTATRPTAVPIRATAQVILIAVFGFLIVS